MGRINSSGAGERIRFLLVLIDFHDVLFTAKKELSSLLLGKVNRN